MMKKIISLLLALSICSPSWGAIAFVQSKSGIGGAGPGSTSAAAAFGSNTASTNFITVVSFWGTSSVTMTIADTQTNTYTSVIGPICNGNLCMQMFYAKNIAGGADTVTQTSSAGTTQGIAVHEYSGIDTSAPFDVTVSSTGSGTAINSTSVTTTLANELLMGGCMTQAPSSFTKGASYNLRENVSAAPVTGLSEDQIVSATGSYSADCSNGLSVAWVALIGTFKQGTAAATSSPYVGDGIN